MNETVTIELLRALLVRDAKQLKQLIDSNSELQRLAAQIFVEADE